MWCIAVRNPIKLIFPLSSQISGCAGLNGHLVSDDMDSARIDVRKNFNAAPEINALLNFIRNTALADTVLWRSLFPLTNVFS